MSEKQRSPEMPPQEGVSLEALGEAFAHALGRQTPLQESPSADEDDQSAGESGGADEHPPGTALGAAPQADEPSVEISPRSITEAILFVGSPGSTPLKAAEIASVMRDVEPHEIPGLIGELNESYAANGCPYRIVHENGGYRLRLRDEFDEVRQRFFGRVRGVRLSQSALDTLAIVAYRQPLTAKEVSEFRGRPSGGLLSQLVRRNLLTVEPGTARSEPNRYRTTDRFLELLGLKTLDDLPRTEEP